MEADKSDEESSLSSSESSSSSGSENDVEILDRAMFSDGFIYYLVKSMGSDNSSCSWVLLQNLDCPQALAKFEQKKRFKEQQDARIKTLRELQRKFDNQYHGTPWFKNKLKKKINFSSLLEAIKNEECLGEAKYGPQCRIPEKIVNAMMIEGELRLLVKWRGSDEETMVSASVANRLFPQLVIDFYESRLVFERS